MKKVEDYVRTIPNFPEPGIMFRDVTSVLGDADGLELAINEMQKLIGNPDDVDVIVGLESRGFIFGMPLAYNLHKPFVLVRKKGKLPCETIEQTYDGLMIKGASGGLYEGGTVSCNEDHPITMVLAILGLRTFRGITIDNASAIRKSWPGFWNALETIDAQLEA